MLMVELLTSSAKNVQFLIYHRKDNILSFGNLETILSAIAFAAGRIVITKLLTKVLPVRLQLDYSFDNDFIIGGVKVVVVVIYFQ
jgi:hypothetical protein